MMWFSINFKTGKAAFFMNWKIFGTLLFAGIVFIQVTAQNQGNRRSVSYYEETVGNLTNQIRLLQDENASLTASVHAMQQELRQMKQQMQAYHEETAQIRRMISEESAARQKQMGGIADKLQKAADAQAKADARARAAAANAHNSGNSAEEFDIYVVEAGATLSAVSRATGVSISRLKQANGMTNDILRVGQKLKIPRK